MSDLTPWEERGGVWLKRDDLYEYGGARGGKARTCLRLAREGLERGARGIVSCGARESTQLSRVALIGQALGTAVRLYVPSGSESSEMRAAEEAGAELAPVKPGYLSVLKARAREWARAEGWAHIPWGLECREALEETAAQVQGFPPQLKRFVVPVGSGMTLAGVLHGLEEANSGLPALGVCVGADPEARLDAWAPPTWRFQVELLPAASPYNRPAPACEYEGARLDPFYEAKCIPHLRPRDGLWVVAIRPSEEREEVIPIGDEFGAWMRALPRAP